MNNYFLDIFADNREALKEIYTQLHITLKNNPDNIAVHFPRYHYNTSLKDGNVGLTLRIFARSTDQLKKLQLQEKAQALKISATFNAINPVPKEILGHCVVTRVRFKSKGKIRREASRAVQAGVFDSFDKALIAKTLINDTFAPLPAVFVHSLSTAKDFPIHIKVAPAETSVKGEFNSYGLSSNATVPVF